MVNAAMDALMGTADGQRGEPSIPTVYALYQNYPNPFNPVTEIRFDLPVASRVVIEIFNTLGQRVKTLADREYAAGAYRMAWDGTNDSGMSAAAGVYLYRMRAGDFVNVRKMVLMR